MINLVMKVHVNWNLLFRFKVFFSLEFWCFLMIYLNYVLGSLHHGLWFSGHVFKVWSSFTINQVGDDIQCFFCVYDNSIHKLWSTVVYTWTVYYKENKISPSLPPPKKKQSTQMVGRKPQNHSNLYSKTVIKIELSQNPKWMFIFSL